MCVFCTKAFARFADRLQPRPAAREAEPAREDRPPAPTGHEASADGAAPAASRAD